MNAEDYTSMLSMVDCDTLATPLLRQQSYNINHGPTGRFENIAEHQVFQNHTSPFGNYGTSNDPMTGSSSTSVLFIESLHSGSDVQIKLAQIESKLNTIMEKVSGSYAVNSLVRSSHTNQPDLIVQKENNLCQERLQTDNDAFCQLLIDKQKLLQENYSLMDQISSLKIQHDKESQQAVVFKEDLERRLKEAMSKLTTARQEAFDASTRESELRHHIENSKIIQERMARDLKTAESQISEYKKRADELKSEFNTARNQLKLKSDSLASQLQQLTRQNEMISQDSTVSKIKYEAEVKKMEDSVKLSEGKHSEDIAKLKESLKQYRRDAEKEIKNQARTIEDNCNKEFKLKYDRHLENVKEQYKTKLKDMEEENAELQEKIKTIQIRMSDYRLKFISSEQQMSNVREELDELRRTRDKETEDARRQLKDSRVHFKEQLRTLNEEKEDVLRRLQTLSQEYQKQNSELQLLHKSHGSVLRRESAMKNDYEKVVSSEKEAHKRWKEAALEKQTSLQHLSSVLDDIRAQLDKEKEQSLKYLEEKLLAEAEARQLREAIRQKTDSAKTNDGVIDGGVNSDGGDIVLAAPVIHVHPPAFSVTVRHIDVNRDSAGDSIGSVCDTRENLGVCFDETDHRSGNICAHVDGGSTSSVWHAEEGVQSDEGVHEHGAADPPNLVDEHDSQSDEGDDDSDDDSYVSALDDIDDLEEKLTSKISGDVLEHDVTSRPDGDMGNKYSPHDDRGTTCVSIYEASSEMSTDTSDQASIDNMSWVMAYESSNEVPIITSLEKSHDVSIVASNEFSIVAQCEISNEVSTAAPFEVSNVVEGVTSNATSNEVSNEVSTDASCEASFQVSTEVSCEASNEVSTEASCKAPNEVSTDASCKASNEVSTDASCEASNEVSTDASCKASNEVSTGASCRTSNEVSTEASCGASNQVSCSSTMSTHGTFNQSTGWIASVGNRTIAELNREEETCFPDDENSQELQTPEIVGNQSMKVHNNIDLKIDIGKARPIEGSRNVEVSCEGSIHGGNNRYPASDFWNESDEFEIQFDVSSAEEFFKSGNSEEDESTYVVTPGGQIMSYSFDLESEGSENLFNENLPDLKCCSVEFATKTIDEGISETDSREEIAELQRNSSTTSESRGFWISEESSVVTPERDINRISTEVNNNSERANNRNNGIEGIDQIQPNLKGACVLLTDEDIRVMLRGSSHQDLERWSGSFDGKVQL